VIRRRSGVLSEARLGLPRLVDLERDLVFEVMRLLSLSPVMTLHQDTGGPEAEKDGEVMLKLTSG
jgi:hypothetical protein